MAKEQNKKLTLLQKVWEWIKDLFLEEYEVTVWFHKETLETDRGLKTSEHTTPKVYKFKRISKITSTFIKGITVEGDSFELRTQHPFDYNIKKIH